MGSTDEGTICQLDQARGMNRAMIKMVEQVIEKTPDSADKVLAISHCNCPARAQVLKEAFQERMKLAKSHRIWIQQVSAPCMPMTVV